MVEVSRNFTLGKESEEDIRVGDYNIHYYSPRLDLVQNQWLKNLEFGIDDTEKGNNIKE